MKNILMYIKITLFWKVLNVVHSGVIDIFGKYTQMYLHNNYTWIILASLLVS